MGKPVHVGARELKTRLGQYLRQVRAGQTLIVTDRGEPVAELRPLPKKKETDAEVWARLVREGVVAPFKEGRPRPFNPIKLKGGEPISVTIQREREDRF